MMARLLLRLATWRNGGRCPCDPCIARRNLELAMRQYRGRVPRHILRQSHRDAWGIGRGGSPT